MDKINHWSMFSNAIVAEETEEILTPEIITDFETSTKCDKTRIKQEPEFVDDYVNERNHILSPIVAMDVNNEEITIKQEFTETEDLTQTREIAQGQLINEPSDVNDDDAIFNFEAECTITEYSTADKSHLLEEADNMTLNVSSTGRPMRTAAILKTGLLSKQALDDQPLDYECAILYICPACGREYFSHEAWKRHLHVQHEFNTRHGLNFVKVDKLYHRCRQCSKHIAMHSMENLLKHKFTHLPYRCTKCRICLRQYKYRQDLLVHLRMTHNKELLSILKSGQWEQENLSIVEREQNEKINLYYRDRASHLAIKDIKANAFNIHTEATDTLHNLVDMHDDDDDAVFVQNERLVLEDEDDQENLLPFEQSNNSLQSRTMQEFAHKRNEMQQDGVC